LADESSSESSSTTSSEEEDEADAASVDSKEIQTIRFDENVCPQGCPRDLYDLTFTLRAQRLVHFNYQCGEDDNGLVGATKILPVIVDARVTVL